MSVSKWAYTPEMCDGEGCPGDCDLCDKPKNMEDEDDMTDYIKREDAKRAMNNGLRYMRAFGVNRLLTMIDEVPSADVRENVRGEWVEQELQSLLGRRHTETRCGNCGYEVYRKTPFCPNCGADMRGEA